MILTFESFEQIYKISNIEMAIYPSSNSYGRDERQQSSEIDMLREMNNVIDIVP